LLLQGRSGDEEEHVLAEKEARKSIEAASTREGYGSRLWTAVQESAEEVVDDARERFFAAGEATTIITTTTGKTLPGQLTTQDPAVLANTLKISKDDAHARIIMIDMIQNAQLEMVKQLVAIGKDLSTTGLRAKADLKALNKSAVASKNLGFMANNAQASVTDNEKSALTLKADVAGLSKTVSADLKLLSDLAKTKNATEKDKVLAKTIPSAKKRVQKNVETMNVLIPRLKGMMSHVTKIESGLWDGNLTEMVSDQTSREVINVMEDVPRGFGRFIPN
jgi:hypothetical protein